MMNPKGVCPSVMAHKYQEIDRVVRKSKKDLMNSKMAVYPSVRQQTKQMLTKTPSLKMQVG